MAHVFRSHYFHLVWSTKGRKDWITVEIKSRLYAYIGGVIKNYQGKLLSIGGTSNHVHLLISIGRIDKFSYLIRDIKSKSTVWIHENFSLHHDFAWQEGYGSFSVGYSSLEKIEYYINNQEKHHNSILFEDELHQFLIKHQLPFDERFVLG